jgi:hypothetical protein
MDPLRIYFCPSCKFVRAIYRCHSLLALGELLKAQDINLHSICLHVLSDSFRRWVLVVLQIPDIMKTTCVTYHAGDDVQY